MRPVLLALLVLCFTGCAGMKLGAGYNFDAKQLFINIEKPLESGLKK
jgi:hypothetical protein